MQRTRFFIALCLLLICSSTILPLQAKESQGTLPNNFKTNGKEAVYVIKYPSGELLFAQNQDAILPPASLTKLMTALLTIEKTQPSDIVTVGNEVQNLEGALIGLLPGDKITVENLLYAMLVLSGNDAANVLAANISGSIENFVRTMNLKAKSFGMLRTNFVNSHGLPASNHLSTAKDLSVLAVMAIENPLIRAITSAKDCEVIWQHKDGSTAQIKIKSSNKLLGVYPGVRGLKTGTTVEAGQCLITYTQWNYGNVIAVLINSTNRYRDTTNILDAAYNDIQLERAADIIAISSWERI